MNPGCKHLAAAACMVILSITLTTGCCRPPAHKTVGVDELRQIVERSGAPDRPGNTAWKYFGTDEAYHYLLCEQGALVSGPDAGRYRTPSGTLSINPQHTFRGYTDYYSMSRTIFEGPGRFDGNSFTRFGIQYGATSPAPTSGRPPVTDWSK